MESLSVSTNRFTLDLYKKLNETSKGQNIFFSPWSIATALAMVHLGAKGDTASQMAEVSSEISCVPPYRELLQKLNWYSAYGEQQGTTREDSDLQCWQHKWSSPLYQQYGRSLPLYFQDLCSPPTLCLAYLYIHRALQGLCQGEVIDIKGYCWSCLELCIPSQLSSEQNN